MHQERRLFQFSRKKELTRSLRRRRRASFVFKQELPLKRFLRSNQYVVQKKKIRIFQLVVPNDGLQFYKTGKATKGRN